jgi:hypothetical protein
MSATDPANAILNLLYRLAEIEAVHACNSLGLLPMLGIAHTDKQNRDSLALDLIEPIRPMCDQIALNLLDTGLGIPYDPVTGRPSYFDRKWVYEKSDGVVRLCPPLTDRLMAESVNLSQAIMPVAHKVAKMLADSADGLVTVRALTKSEKPPAQGKRYYPRVHLRPGVGTADVIPDALWSQVQPILTNRPVKASGSGRRPSPPSREIVAALTLREICRVPWHEVGVKIDTCQAWLTAWTNDGTWPRVKAMCEASGHLGALVT